MSHYQTSYISCPVYIVYSLERFSRNDNSIWLSGQLRKLGVEIVSVTQPIDTSNPSGQMQPKMLFLFGEFDSQLRKQKCMAGVKKYCYVATGRQCHRSGMILSGVMASDRLY